MLVSLGACCAMTTSSHQHARVHQCRKLAAPPPMATVVSHLAHIEHYTYLSLVYCEKPFELHIHWLTDSLTDSIIRSLHVQSPPELRPYWFVRHCEWGGHLKGHQEDSRPHRRGGYACEWPMVDSEQLRLCMARLNKYGVRSLFVACMVTFMYGLCMWTSGQVDSMKLP